MKTKINTEVVEVNDTTVKLQSKPDNEAVNGWSVIAYLPDFSIRSKALHNRVKLDRFIMTIIIAAGYHFHELVDDDSRVADQAERDIDDLKAACKRLMPTL
jgi:hypothetical protein